MVARLEPGTGLRIVSIYTIRKHVCESEDDFVPYSSDWNVRLHVLPVRQLLTRTAWHKHFLLHDRVM